MRMTDERAFELIGLPATSTEAEVKRAYRTAALVHHPDRGGSSDAMKELNEAYEVALEATHGRAEQEAGEPEVVCPRCGGTEKVKVTRGFDSVELACPVCAVET